MDTQTTQPLKSDEHNFEYLKYCHGKIDEIKASIYQRASILVVVMSFILLAWLEVIKLSIADISQQAIILRIISGVLSAMFLTTFLLALINGIECLVPFKNKSALWSVLTSRKNTTDKNNINDIDWKKRIVFTTFTYICNLEEHEFARMVSELDSGKVLEQLTVGIYDLSAITQKRYNDLFVACKYLWWSTVLFIITFVFEMCKKIF